MTKVEFAEQFRNRTKELTLKTMWLFKELKKSDETQLVGRQLIRCSSSVAANYRAACRARSKAEFYAKISIVVEEADEVLFWLEVLNELEVVNKDLIDPLQKEAKEILKVMSKARKTTSKGR